MRPEEVRFVPEVRVDERPTGLHLACDRCSHDEIVLLDRSEFDNAVRRFTRVHPTACQAGTGDSADSARVPPK